MRMAKRMETYERCNDECYFYDGGFCEYYNDDCKNHPTCNGE